MSEPFIAQITMFAGNFAPRSWALCDGQLLPIAQNSALFSILGTTYGGDGRTTFALPELRGRFPMHQGTGPGLRNKRLGERGGVEDTVLTSAQMPPHTHVGTMKAASTIGDAASPAGNHLAQSNDGENNFSNSSSDASLAANSLTIGSSGGGQAHTNMPPFLAVNFIIALQGIFPSRN